MDRRIRRAQPPSDDDGKLICLPRRPLNDVLEELPEMQELSWRIRDRWKFDDDDEPAIGPDGPDEQDRMLVDDYSAE